MEGIEHDLDNMRGYLMKSTTHCLQNYWKNGTRGKKDFRRPSSWEGRPNLIRWENLNEGHDTPVEWIDKGKKHDLGKTRWWDKERNITMPPEQMNGKLDGWKEKNGEEEWQLSQIKLKEHAYEENVERSCWIINSEKSKLVVGLWKTSRNYEVQLCH